MHAGRPITGPELATLLEVLVTAANEGSLAEVSCLERGREGGREGGREREREEGCMVTTAACYRYLGDGRCSLIN